MRKTYYEDDHAAIVEMLVELLNKYGKLHLRDELLNCWETGVMKSIVEINKYYQNKENKIKKERR